MGNAPQQPLPTQDDARARDHRIQELELRPSERDVVSLGGHESARARVEAPAGERLDLRGRRGVAPYAAQQGLYPGQKLARIEGLGYVVVGSDLQPHDPVDVIRAPGNEDDAHIVARTNEAGEVQTVLSRQVDVEEHEIHRIVDQQPAQLPTIDRLAHSMPGRFQIAGKFRSGNVVVFDDQHMGRFARQRMNTLNCHLPANLTSFNKSPQRFNEHLDRC